jgi:hypothetical protein
LKFYGNFSRGSGTNIERGHRENRTYDNKQCHYQQKFLHILLFSSFDSMYLSERNNSENKTKNNEKHPRPDKRNNKNGQNDTKKHLFYCAPVAGIWHNKLFAAGKQQALNGYKEFRVVPHNDENEWQPQ